MAERASSGDASTDAGDQGRWQVGGGPAEGPERGGEWGRYRVEALLGSGGMGRVWKAWDTLLRRPVALKCLVAQDGASVERLLREARAQARIEHDNVCKVYDAGDVAGRPYIAMQLVAGGSLGEAAAEMSVEQLAEVMRQVAEGVHAAHRTGLIHRDLKPGNILIERGEDGKPHPYVADFGVARDTAAPHETRVGLAVGSLYYMAPEQAGAAAIDRRVDVWGLGATLYELLCGQPPFGKGQASEVLLRLLQAEVTPIGRRAAGLPPDLQRVVMKCLEREPERRYDSARALAADLRRYLDGDPVSARPAGWWYRTAKRLRKHRAATAVGALGVVALGGLALFGWRAQWRARESALAAQRFGRQVQEIETTLRIAYLLPLHDVRPDQRLVQERMRQLAAQAERLGDLARGPGHYALGRGYLALHRLEEAHRELSAAWDLGYRAPEVAYALGRVLTERYQSQIERESDLADEDLRRARRQEAERKFLAPARAALAASRGAPGESRQYLLALLALAEHRLPAAVRHAARAFAEDPGHFEAGLLMGDVHLQLGREARERGDYEGAAAWLAAGRSDDAAAAAVARSAPEILAARCSLEAAALDLAWARGGSGEALETALGAVRSACGTALAADPQSVAAQGALAQAYLVIGLDREDHGVDPAGAFDAVVAATTTALAAPDGSGTPAAADLVRRRAEAWLRMGRYQAEHGGDPTRCFARALADGQQAATLAPGSAVTHQQLGFAQLALGEYQIGRGLDPTPALDSAAASFRRGLAIDPSVANLHHRLAYTLFQRAAYDRLHGHDPRPLLAAAEASYRRTLAINPRTFQAYSNLGNAYELAGEYALDNGLDPRPDLAQAVASYRGALALQPRYPSAHQNLGAALLTRARYETKAGADPRPVVEQARQELEAARQLNPKDPDPLSNLATGSLNVADYLCARGVDPAAAIAEGRRQVDASLALNPNDAEVIRTRADLAIVAARWSLSRGGAPARLLAAAERDVRASLAANDTDALSWADLATVEELRCEPGITVLRRPPAQRLGAAGDGCPAAISRGSAAIQKALALHPRMADGERLQGILELAAARQAASPAEQRQAAARAHAALSRAAALDPLLRSAIALLPDR